MYWCCLYPPPPPGATNRGVTKSRRFTEDSAGLLSLTPSSVSHLSSFYMTDLVTDVIIHRLRHSEFQANAPRWLCNEAWGRRLLLQWHATRCQHKLRLQLQEEVSLPVAPADLRPVLHSLHPIHFSEHLTVWLQVCHLIITHLLANGVYVCVCCLCPKGWCVVVLSYSHGFHCASVSLNILENEAKCSKSMKPFLRKIHVEEPSGLLCQIMSHCVATVLFHSS